MAANIARSAGEGKGAQVRSPPGELAEPITIALTQPMVFHPDEAREAMKEANAEEWRKAQAVTFAKVALLFDDFGIERTGNDAADLMALVLRLARAHFPGFRVVDVNEPKPYRHRRKDVGASLMLLADIELLNLELNRSDSASVQIMATTARFNGAWGWYRGRERTLRNWVSDARGDHHAASRLLQPFKAAGRVRAFIDLFGSAGTKP